MMMIEQAKGHPGEPGSQTLSLSHSGGQAASKGCSSSLRLRLSVVHRWLRVRGSCGEAGSVLDCRSASLRASESLLAALPSTREISRDLRISWHAACVKRCCAGI